jgi:hypothetical protein
VNTLRVEATTAAGGSSAETRQVNYVPRPVQILIDGLTPRGGKGIAPRQSFGGRLTFPPVEKSLVRLKGHVVWDESEDERLQKAAAVQVYVNGFQQRRLPLAPPAPGGQERAFEADLLLGQTDNQVWLTLPDLPPEEGAPSQFQVDCTHPEQALRLHLLILSPPAKDDRALRKRFFEVFEVTGAEESFRTNVFDQVYPYGPLVDYNARREFVDKQLTDIQWRIKDQAEHGAGGNDLVVLYYQGQERFDDKGNYYPTRLVESGAPDEGERLRPDDLAKLFQDTPGAFVLLLDVDRAGSSAKGAPERDAIKKWEANYPEITHNATVVRYAWLGAPGAPPNRRLIQALQEGMPKAATLLDATQFIRKFAAREKSLTDDEYLAIDMRGIPLHLKP